MPASEHGAVGLGWIGRPLSALETSAILFVGVYGIMFAGVGPLLLGALERTGRLTAPQIGQAGMIELLTMGIAAGLTGTILGTRHLKALTICCGLAMALLNVATARYSGTTLVVLRGLAGIPSGALIWLMTAMIVRMPRPERWAAIYFTVQTLAQFLVTAALGAWIMRPYGPDGGFMLLAAMGVVSALVGLAVPAALEALPKSETHSSGRPSRRGLAALCAAFCFNAAIFAVWIYVEPLSRQAGNAASVAEIALSVSLAAQVVGGVVATLVAGRIRWFAALIASQAGMIALMAVFARLPGATLFIASSAVLGGLWMFSAPMLTPLAIEADPTRRAAAMGAGAALLGCSAGPLAASLIVSDTSVVGSAWLGAGLMVVALGLVVILHLTGGGPLRTEMP